MSVSPFAFYRGAALTMASDLATTPVSGLRAQLCGDAHLMNFGLFAAPDRNLIFDVNDFDETLPGPWEWDVKRLAASVVIAARDRGFTVDQGRDAVISTIGSYRTWMASYAAMDDSEVWYSRVTADETLAVAKQARGVRTKGAAKIITKARSHDSLQAFGKLTTVVDGVPHFVERPPLIAHLTAQQADLETLGRGAFVQYKRTLPDEWRVLLDRYAFVDLAFKIVGVGSVGTRDLVVLFMGRDDGDPLILQLKEAGASVLEAYAGRSRYLNHGRRVVVGQHVMQAASDIFLGWVKTGGSPRRDFYVRQDCTTSRGRFRSTRHARRGSWCMEASAHGRSPALTLAPVTVWRSPPTWARANASTRRSPASRRPRDQAERDFALLTKAIKQGRIKAETGV